MGTTINHVFYKTREEKGSMYYMTEKRKLAKGQGPSPSAGENNYIQMTNQLRMNCSEEG